ncbi:MAG: hypothetical protein MK080_11780 [Opitutales bacterium]|nr:hypothetical protein [Opitutales bacterium]NRA28406.1 hypothetical protein [Opitutales bacterium]
MGDIETDRWEVRAPMHIRFFDTFNLLGLASFEYLDIAGSRVYGGGGQLGVPFKLYSNAEAERTWVLTPNVGIEGRGGIDIASGNIMLQVGLTSHYTMRATERLKLTIINQVSTFESLTLKYDDIEFKPDIDQWIVKNEIAFDLQMNAWSVLSASLTDTRFLNEAAIDDYQDLEIGLAATTGSFWTISTFARHTFANGYDATTAGAYVDFGF